MVLELHDNNIVTRELINMNRIIVMLMITYDQHGHPHHDFRDAHGLLHHFPHGES